MEVQKVAETQWAADRAFYAGALRGMEAGAEGCRDPRSSRGPARGRPTEFTMRGVEGHGGRRRRLQGPREWQGTCW